MIITEREASLAATARVTTTMVKLKRNKIETKQLRASQLELAISQKETSETGLTGEITEIITADKQPKNLSMLLPLLAMLSKSDRWFAWISPPKNLPKDLLQDAGIALNKIMMLYPDEHTSALNLTKKALRSGTCHVVISWNGDISEHELANLELSARQGGSHGILLRSRTKH